MSISKPLTTATINSAIGSPISGARAVSTLAKHSNINKFAKYKPVQVNAQYEIGYDQRAAVNFGVTAPVLNLTNGAAHSVWSYSKPSSNYRMLDFNSYEHGAVRPTSYSWPAKLVADNVTTFTAYFNGNVSGWNSNSLALADPFYSLGAGSFYLALALIDSNSSVKVVVSTGVSIASVSSTGSLTLQITGNSDQSSSYIYVSEIGSTDYRGHTFYCIWVAAPSGFSSRGVYRSGFDSLRSLECDTNVDRTTLITKRARDFSDLTGSLSDIGFTYSGYDSSYYYFNLGSSTGSVYGNSSWPSGGTANLDIRITAYNGGALQTTGGSAVSPPIVVYYNSVSITTSTLSRSASFSGYRLAVVKSAGRGTITVQFWAREISGSTTTGDMRLLAEKTTTIDFSRQLTGISMSPTTLSGTTGGSGSVTVTASYNDGTTANVTSSTTFGSTNTSVATCSGGTVSYVGAGSANITASYGGYYATCSVTVTSPAPAITSIHFEQSSYSIRVGWGLSLKVLDQNGNNVTSQCNHTSSNPNIIISDQSSCTVTATAVAFATITAKLKTDTTITAACSVAANR